MIRFTRAGKYTTYIFVLFCFFHPITSHSSGILDGMVFTISIDEVESDVSFNNGTFQSSFWKHDGYREGKYTTTANGVEIYFEANLVNDENENIQWQGVVSGDNITGKYYKTEKGWFVFGDTTKRATFQGELK